MSVFAPCCSYSLFFPSPASPLPSVSPILPSLPPRCFAYPLPRLASSQSGLYSSLLVFPRRFLSFLSPRAPLSAPSRAPRPHPADSTPPRSPRPLLASTFDPAHSFPPAPVAHRLVLRPFLPSIRVPHPLPICPLPPRAPLCPTFPSHLLHSPLSSPIPSSLRP